MGGTELCSVLDSFLRNNQLLEKTAFYQNSTRAAGKQGGDLRYLFAAKVIDKPSKRHYHNYKAKDFFELILR